MKRLIIGTLALLGILVLSMVSQGCRQKQETLDPQKLEQLLDSVSKVVPNDSALNAKDSVLKVLTITSQQEIANQKESIKKLSMQVDSSLKKIQNLNNVILLQNQMIKNFQSGKTVNQPLKK